MIVAIPIDSFQRVYHYNPCSAMMFALYEITGVRTNINYRHVESKLNPWKKCEGEMVSNEQVKEGKCNREKSNDPHHISEHYALLEVIGKSDYLIAGQYCLNTFYAMRNVGIKIHKIPPFMKTINEAMNHFIIGAEIADNLQHIHAVS